MEQERERSEDELQVEAGHDGTLSHSPELETTLLERADSKETPVSWEQVKEDLGL